MSTTSHEVGESGTRPRRKLHNWPFPRTRCLLGGFGLGLLAASWAGGLSDRYGEPEGVVGTFRGACRTAGKGFRYTVAHVRDCFAEEATSVRSLGLGQQVETRLCQDKKLDAQDITVHIDEDGTATLRGLVPDASHKEKAVALTRDTRGVVRVVDHLAVPPPPRVIETPVGDSVPTGIASQTRTVR